MAEIGVVQRDLMAKGGAEAVTMQVLEALQPHHDITVHTITAPDFAVLNDYFDTAIDPTNITVQQTNQVTQQIHQQYGLDFIMLQHALLADHARQYRDDYDCMISTANELGLGPDAVEYVHFPFDWYDNAPGTGFLHPHLVNDADKQLYAHIAGVTQENITSGTLVANSPWTAQFVKEAYGVDPAVVYPPVDVDVFPTVPWHERDDGFVTIARVEPPKRIATLITIIDRVRNRGHDTHLHIAGPPAHDTYHDTVRKMAQRRDHVTLHGEMSYDDLLSLVATHKYGIHGKTHEPFGMAVAELAAGGTLPFVPATGGPPHIVQDDRLQYTSVADAVDTIDTVLSSDQQYGLRLSKSAIRQRFGRTRFQHQIQDLVTDTLDESRPRQQEPYSTSGRSTV